VVSEAPPSAPESSPSVVPPDPAPAEGQPEPPPVPTAGVSSQPSDPVTGVEDLASRAQDPLAMPPEAQEIPPSFSPEAYSLRVLRQIEAAKDYPVSALRRGLEGTVVVGFSVDRNGGLVQGPTLSRASNFESLNRAAIQAVLEAAPFPRRPEPDASEILTYHVPIVFELQGQKHERLRVLDKKS